MAQGGWQHHGADALVLYALTIAALLSLVSTMGVAGGGRWLYTRVGVTGGAGCCVRPWDERTLDENGL
jgi:hypothetical protein